MSGTPDPLEERLRRIEERLGALEHRMAAGETGAVEPPPAAGADRLAGAPDVDLGAALSLLGRTFIVFGGAYLLRALMESETLPPGVAVTLGFLYALVWLGAADRAAAAGRLSSSLFHGGTSVVIAFPLLWESSTRFDFFGAPATAAMLALFSGLALLVAWRRRLQGLAAATTLAALGTVFALALGAGQVLEPAVFLVLLGVATLWLSYDRDWHWLRWPPALAADGFAVVLAGLALREPPAAPPEAVMALQLFLLAAYLASIAARTVVRGREVMPFEVLQTVIVLAAGLGGALAVGHAMGTARPVLGLASIALGGGCYAVAFFFVDRERGLALNFHFYLWLALLLLITGGVVLLPPAPLSVVLAGLALAATWLGARLARGSLALQAAVFGLAASLASGLLADAGAALVGTPPEPAAALFPAALAVLAALVLCLVPPPAGPPATGAATAARLAIAALAFAGVAGLSVAALAPLLAGTPPDAGILATLRSAVLAAAAVLVAGATRAERWRDLGGLVVPLLVLGGLKLLAEDLRVSRPATLFVALALYGAALVAAARLARRAPAAGTDG